MKGLEEYNGTRVMIAGATGFIGSHLAEVLASVGAHVLSIARTAERYPNLAGVRGKHRFALCDICDAGALSSLVAEHQPSIFFHMAALPDSERESTSIAQYLATNSIGALNAAEACGRVKCRRFVFADSCKVYGNQSVPYHLRQLPAPNSPYTISKTAGWQFAQLIASQSGLDVTGLRFPFVYGPRQGWNLIRYVERCAAENVAVDLQGGSQTRDPLFVSDAVAALLAAGIEEEAVGVSIPIGGGVEISVRQMCEEILRLLGKDTAVRENTVPMRMTEIYRSLSSNTDALRLLNWSPRYNFTEGLKRTLSGWRCGADESAGERHVGQSEGA